MYHFDCTFPGREGCVLPLPNESMVNSNEKKLLQQSQNIFKHIVRVCPAHNHQQTRAPGADESNVPAPADAERRLLRRKLQFFWFRSLSLFFAAGEWPAGRRWHVLQRCGKEACEVPEVRVGQGETLCDDGCISPPFADPPASSTA